MARPGVPLVGFRILVKGGGESDPADRAGLAFFHADWSEPTHYHVTCCSSRLPLPAIARALGGFLGNPGEVSP